MSLVRSLCCGLVAAVGFLVAALPPSLALGAQERKPNIIYFMSDELSYYELSGMGNPRIKTPNIDALAADGIRFTQALAGNCVCAPTRCCLMTGKHSGHTSVRKNDGGTPMRAGEETIASMLKRAGYATGGFGKWGCGGRGSTGVPETHGFDVFLGYYDQVHAHSYYPPYIVRNSQEVPLAGNHGASDGRTYSHYVIFDAAMDFIRANKDRPFFCYLPVTPPHGMYDIPDSDPAWSLYKDEPWPEDAKRYAAMVSMVDRQLGELIELVKQLGLDERTILFFCGDNGGQDRFKSEEYPRGFFGPNVDPKTGFAFRGGKGNLYEGGLRIPMFVRFPGKINPGRTSDLAWYFSDVLPTVAELAGVEPPKDIDGISIVPELFGQPAAGRKQPQHEYLYWEYRGQTAVRMGPWKAVLPRASGPWELYDLGRDLGEEHNVAETHPDVLDRLKAFAARAHVPAEEGTFDNRDLHERDRRAKFGDTEQPDPAPSWQPGRRTKWHGYDRFHFILGGRDCYVVVPKWVAAGKPWVWRARFPDYHAEMDVTLLGKGYHVAYVDVAGLFGSPQALAHGEKLYAYLTAQHGFSPKPVLEGVSRGGLFVYNWAASNPDKVACIYADTPVCDFKSWPGGKGKGLGSGRDWAACLKAYGFTEAEALQYDKNPVDNVAPIAAAKIPILHIISESDRVVPPAENTRLLDERLRGLGGSMEIISVAQGTAESNGHHFDHPNPQKVVDFIVRHAARPAK